MSLPQTLLIIVGLFTIASGVFGWDLVIGHWKSRLFVKWFGERGTRVFYVLLGLGIVAFGVWLPNLN